MLNDINELAITYLPIETFTIHYSRMLSEIDPVNYIVTLIDNYTGKKGKQERITLKNPRWIDIIPVILNKMGICLNRTVIAFSHMYKIYELRYNYYTFLNGKLIKLKTWERMKPFSKYFIEVQSEQHYLRFDCGNKAKNDFTFTNTSNVR